MPLAAPYAELVESGSMGGRRGTCKEEIAGWEDRVKGKAAAGGIGGLAGGLVLSAVKNLPVFRTAILTASNVAIAGGLFGTFQETFRMLTCQDSPLNSVYAGGFAGYLLGLVQHGPGRGPPVSAFTFAVLGGMCHVLDDRGIRAAPAARAVLESLDLIEVKDGGVSAGSADDGEALKWFERWLPIRQLTDEEYENVKKQQALKEAYGMGEIEHADYKAEMEALQLEAAVRKFRTAFGSQQGEKPS